MRRSRLSSSSGGSERGPQGLSWVTHALSPGALLAATAGVHRVAGAVSGPVRTSSHRAAHAPAGGRVALCLRPPKSAGRGHGPPAAGRRKVAGSSLRLSQRFHRLSRPSGADDLSPRVRAWLLDRSRVLGIRGAALSAVTRAPRAISEPLSVAEWT